LGRLGCRRHRGSKDHPRDAAGPNHARWSRLRRGSWPRPRRPPDSLEFRTPMDPTRSCLRSLMSRRSLIRCRIICMCPGRSRPHAPASTFYAKSRSVSELCSERRPGLTSRYRSTLRWTPQRASLSTIAWKKLRHAISTPSRVSYFRARSWRAQTCIDYLSD